MSLSGMGLGPCAACKAHRRKCTSDCIFAPLFPADQPHKFALIHTVYGGSNVAKILKELAPEDRPGAIQSLVFEAECRIRDPVYGVVGPIYLLQQQLKQVQAQLLTAKRALSLYDPDVFTPYPHQLPLYASSGYLNSNHDVDMSPDAGLGFGNSSKNVTYGHAYGVRGYPATQETATFRQEQQLVGPSCERELFGLTARLGLLGEEEEEEEERYYYGQGIDRAILLRPGESSTAKWGGRSS